MSARAKTTGPKNVYQLKITLKGTKPPIWRRVQVAGDITLAKLHRIIQVVMGWENYHLYQFTIGNEYYGRNDAELGDDFIDDKRYKLSQVASAEKGKFLYEYDFGDSWVHEVLVEKILPLEEGKRYPVCIAGKMACPPEDIGGVWGYYTFLDAVKDPSHPEHETMTEWIGGDFSPETFNPEAVNEELRKLR